MQTPRLHPNPSLDAARDPDATSIQRPAVLGYTVSLPWLKLDTAAVQALRESRLIEGRAATELEVLAEFSMLACTDQISRQTLRGLASQWGWSRGRLVRRLQQWADCGALPWLENGGPQVKIMLPTWWTTVFNKSQEDTATGGPQTDHKRTTNVPRARSSIEEKEKEREHTPAPDQLTLTPQEPTPDPSAAAAALGFRLGKGISPSKVSAGAASVWRAWTSEDGWCPGLALTKPRLQALNARLGDFGAQALIELGRWVNAGEDDRAVFLRDRGDPLTLLRASNCEGYLERMRRVPEAQPAWDPGAEALAILDREARQRGPSDPPRRQRDGAWFVRWRFPAPSVGQDSPEWQEAVWSGLRAAGGWGAWCGLAGRERDFTRRRVAAEVQQKMRRSG